MLPRRSQFGEYPEERDPDPLARALRRPMGEPSLPPAAFDHLSRERQLGLLWRLAGPMAGYLDRDDAIEYVAQLSPTPCTPPGTLVARITAGAAGRFGASGHGEAVRSREAVPGSDGRYHLRVGDVIVCGDGQSPGGTVQYSTRTSAGGAQTGKPTASRNSRRIALVSSTTEPVKCRGLSRSPEQRRTQLWCRHVSGARSTPGQISGRGSTAGRRGSSSWRLSAPWAASATHAAT